MADLVRNLLFSLFVIVLISLAASDISVQNVKCEMTCALNYSQVSLFSDILCPNRNCVLVKPKNWPGRGT